MAIKSLQWHPLRFADSSPGHSLDACVRRRECQLGPFFMKVKSVVDKQRKKNKRELMDVLLLVGYMQGMVPTHFNISFIFQTHIFGVFWQYITSMMLVEGKLEKYVLWHYQATNLVQHIVREAVCHEFGVSASVLVLLLKLHMLYYFFFYY